MYWVQPIDDAGPVDAVLLSHDQHADNLDVSGRKYCARSALVLCTPASAKRLGPPARALRSWERLDMPRPAAGPVRITAVPARHGPDGTEHLTGPVTGFVLEGDGLPTVYVSGDNASLDVVREIAGRFPAIDIAVLHGGAARTAPLGEANLTLDAAGMAQAARILGASAVVPVHVDGWAHFTEGLEDVTAAFMAAHLGHLLMVPGPVTDAAG